MMDNGSSADRAAPAPIPRSGDSPAVEMIAHARWSRMDESPAFFIDEDGLRRWFYCLLATGVGLLGTLIGGLWRLRRAALAPPVFIGIAHGLVFSGHPEGIGSVQETDFDPQLADTVEVLFSRTEKGLPPELADFCAPEAGRGGRPSLSRCRQPVSRRLRAEPGPAGGQGRREPARPAAPVLPRIASPPGRWPQPRPAPSTLTARS